MNLHPRLIHRYAAALGWVAASTATAEVLFRATQSTRLSMVFLAGVLLTAFFHGAGPAYLGAVLAVVVYNFYLVDPRFSLSFEAEDLINLVAFLAVAMLTGSLTGRVRDQAARAEARAKATDVLFQATRDFSSLSDEAAIRERLAEHLAVASQGASFVRDGLRHVSRPADAPPSAELVQVAAVLDRTGGEAPVTDAVGPWTIRTLRTLGQSLGVAGWRDDAASPSTSDERRLLEIMTDAGAAALGRARLAAAKADAEARARTEDLRNALLSSISHDLRTPLAAILASASSLREFGESFDASTRQDLASTIQEEAERMDAFVANLLNMTRLEAGALAIQRAPFNVSEVVRRTVERRNRNHRRFTVTSASPRLPEALGDPVLFEQALGNVVENALRYTPEGAVIMVVTREQDSRVVVDVRDAGPGVPGKDLERIFDKFYRGPNSAQKPGTGLGLAIARGIMQAMQGAITAHNREDGGLSVSLSLEAAAP